MAEDSEAPWRDEETLRELYVEEGMNQKEMADELGCTEATIGTWMDRHEIERRSRSEIMRDRTLSDPVPLEEVDGHPRWVDGYGKRRGDGIDRVSVHRLLYVAHYGFEAVRGKEVHHRNEVPWDNRIENLEALTKAEHTRVHNRQRNFSGEAVP